MKKLLLLFVVLLSFTSQAQVAFDSIPENLLPENMQKYLGKVNREQFEKLVGEPVGYEDGNIIVYNVINTYTKMETGIRCLYNKTTGKLISVRFGTRSLLAYWIGFTELKGYPKTEAEAKRLGMYSPKRNSFGKIYQVGLKLKDFGCQILNMDSNSENCTINYHIVQ